jgi:single-stranded DNA-binding protein
MARVLVSGTLFQAPESRSLKNGGLCVTAIVKAKEPRNDNRTPYWHIAALSETVQSVLVHLSHGDAVVVQGTLKAEIHERNGEFAVSCGVLAEHVLRNVASGEDHPKCPSIRAKLGSVTENSKASNRSELAG